jgi:hypothetical protein
MSEASRNNNQINLLTDGFSLFVSNRLADVLEDMNIPNMRKDISIESNVRWLMRNISIQNGSNPLITEAQSLLKQHLKQLSKAG